MEQFCTNEISKELNGLGFNEACFGGWDDNKNWYYHPDSDITLDAPLWQQAIDFVFKKLDFYYPMLSFKVFSDGSGEWYNPKDEGYNSLEINFDNKEEMILKAIEIIKNK